MNRTPRAFVAILVTLAGCHPAPGAAPGTPPAAVARVHDRSGLDVPTRVGRYSLQSPDSTATASGDTPYRFSDGSQTRVTVFVYDVPADVRQGAGPQAWVTSEGEKFADVLRIGVARGWYENFEVAFSEPQPVVRDTLAIPGYAVAAATRSRGRISVELEYLYLVRDRFLKVRATVPERGWTETDVPRFAEQLALAIVDQ